MTSIRVPELGSKVQFGVSVRAAFLAVLAAASWAAAGGAGDSVPLVLRKDTGWRLLPASLSSTVAKPDLNFRPSFEGTGPSRPWVRWDHLQVPDGSAPYGWSTGSWYNYFKETTSQGVVDPARKRNRGFIVGGE